MRKHLGESGLLIPPRLCRGLATTVDDDGRSQCLTQSTFVSRHECLEASERRHPEAADCVDAVGFDGETYIDIDDVPDYRGPTNSSEPQLGDLALVIAKEVCGERLNNGEATTLAAGSELFFVVGEPDMLGRVTVNGVRLFVASSEYATVFVSP